MTTASLPEQKAPVVHITAEAVPAQAFADLLDGARLYELWSRLAFHDIRQRFRRSVLGPFWLTLSMGTMVGTLGFVFSTLFHQDVAKMLPYIATGIIFWGLLTSCINEGTTIFISAESDIRNLAIPLSVHFYRMMARNLMIWGLNMAIYVVVVVRAHARMERSAVHPRLHSVSYQSGLDIAGGRGALHPLSRYTTSSPTCSRWYFTVTPIFWSPESLPSRPAFVALDPFYHLIRGRPDAATGRDGIACELGPLHRHGADRFRHHWLALSPTMPHRILILSLMAHISIKDLTVEFAIFGANAHSLKNKILSQATGGRVMSGARDIVTVRAIDGISLEINDGDRVGLIGHNGSGKTTLLRVLAGIYKPNGGAITIEGRVGALLHPSAGMDPESTGIENIYLRGYMMGMSRREITAKLDDIAEFTELGGFLELPLRTYSAGMFARLAFAVSTAAQSDILLIDEGLGAGDAEFQKKVKLRIESIFNRTPIAILASHSEAMIAEFCTRRVQMEHGALKSVG